VRTRERALQYLAEAWFRFVGLLRRHPDKDTMTTPKPKRDPAAVFATAEQFVRAHDCLLHEGIEKGLQVPMPTMAIAAMTLELYLKCLALLEGKEAREDSHHLWKLFTYLNGATQNKIRRRADERIQRSKPTFRDQHGVVTVVTDFDKLLKLSANALKTSRYPYEGLPANSGWAAGSILFATREVILEMRPDFDGASLNYPGGISAPAIGPA
jgi:hypothetical protein